MIYKKESNKNTEHSILYNHFRNKEFAESVHRVDTFITKLLIYLILISVNTFMGKWAPETISDHIGSSFAEIILSYYNVVMNHPAHLKHPFKFIWYNKLR